MKIKTEHLLIVGFGSAAAILLYVGIRMSRPTPEVPVTTMRPDAATPNTPGNATVPTGHQGATAVLSDTSYHLRAGDAVAATGNVLARGTSVSWIQYGQSVRNGIRISLVRVTSGTFNGRQGYLFVPESFWRVGVAVRSGATTPSAGETTP